jgi:D-sedoheptulose 7-phosphate isomerase
MEKMIIQKLEEHVAMINAIKSDPNLLKEINNIIKIIINCYRKNKKVILFGCGGSAADSQHIAAEFVNRLNLERKSLPAIALTTDTSILTAIGNDYGFDNIFNRQIEALANDGDIAIGISTSGVSKSVLNGLTNAKDKHAITILLTGTSGRKDVADYVINIPSDTTARIQEAHITLGHIICNFVERGFFNEVS